MIRPSVSGPEEERETCGSCGMTPSELRAAAGNVMAGIMSATMCPVCQGRDFDKHVDEQTPVTILVCQECGFDGDESYFKTRELAPERTSDAEDLAEHILATVRDDDREAVTVERLGWEVRSPMRYLSPESTRPGPIVYVAWTPYTGCDGWEIVNGCDHCPIPPLETMSEVRDLCRALQIELKETP